uniref:Uncharacterized protein n=1 Tax=Elaeophora elaphi TaxID=1147741 RepID=A0A0R3RWJ6_9BILA
MFIHFQIFILIIFVGQLITKPIDEDLPNPTEGKMTLEFPACLICKEKQQQLDSSADKDGEQIARLLDNDVRMGTDSLHYLIDEVHITNLTAWLQNPTDPNDWKDEVTKFQQIYETLECDKATSQLEALKAKGNAFEMEKSANKKNALEKWRNLAIIRLRINKIERSILESDNFSDHFDALLLIDTIRSFAYETSNALQKLYDYYKEMDDKLSQSYSILTEIEEKINAKREKEGKVRRTKCILFFCY